ncbi:hypothetical protein F53441_2297 [Fusarium austroafricanum]|uniref:Uncharacterized protein n=1 Tax=Fusarium austroafricanum TaxID=2364996 RepID=A0A8H4KRQ8_9HYPO|nr:hypothetical protein F53441_2297 [Fusarium austroafricanum]
MASTISDAVLQNFTAPGYQAIDVSSRRKGTLSKMRRTLRVKTLTTRDHAAQHRQIPALQAIQIVRAPNTGPQSWIPPSVWILRQQSLRPEWRVSQSGPPNHTWTASIAQLNQQVPCQPGHMSAGDATSCTNAPFDISATSLGSQPYMDASDEQAAGAVSGPGIMITDSLSDQGSCHRSQSTLASLSIRTNSPIAATPNKMAQTLHDGEFCASISPDDAVPETRTSSLVVRLSSESRQEQDFDHTSCPPIDTEAESSRAKSGSLLGVRVSPQPQELLSRRHSRRRSTHTHVTVQDKGHCADAESSGSEDGLDAPGCGRDEDYCPSPPKLEGYGSREESDDEEQHGPKRRRVSQAPHTSVRSIPASTRSSRQRRSTRHFHIAPRARSKSGTQLN